MLLMGDNMNRVMAGEKKSPSWEEVLKTECQAKSFDINHDNRYP